MCKPAIRTTFRVPMFTPFGNHSVRPYRLVRFNLVVAVCAVCYYSVLISSVDVREWGSSQPAIAPPWKGAVCLENSRNGRQIVGIRIDNPSVAWPKFGSSSDQSGWPKFSSDRLASTSHPQNPYGARKRRRPLGSSPCQPGQTRAVESFAKSSAVSIIPVFVLFCQTSLRLLSTETSAHSYPSPWVFYRDC